MPSLCWVGRLDTVSYTHLDVYKRQELHCTVDEPTAAYVFKTVADPFVGKLSYLRVVSGKVTAGEPLTNARTGDRCV